MQSNGIAGSNTKKTGFLRAWDNLMEFSINQYEETPKVVKTFGVFKTSIKGFFYTNMLCTTSFLASFLVPSNPSTPPTVVYFITYRFPGLTN